MHLAVFVFTMFHRSHWSGMSLNKVFLWNIAKWKSIFCSWSCAYLPMSHKSKQGISAMPPRLVPNQ